MPPSSVSPRGERPGFIRAHRSGAGAALESACARSVDLHQPSAPRISRLGAPVWSALGEHLRLKCAVRFPVRCGVASGRGFLFIRTDRRKESPARFIATPGPLRTAAANCKRSPKATWQTPWRRPVPPRLLHPTHRSGSLVGAGICQVIQPGLFPSACTHSFLIVFLQPPIIYRAGDLVILLQVRLRQRQVVLHHLHRRVPQHHLQAPRIAPIP